MDNIEDYLRIKNLLSDKPGLIRKLDTVKHEIRMDPDSVFPRTVEAQTQDAMMILHEALKDAPKEFVDYICGGKNIFEFEWNDLKAAWGRYDEFAELDWFFVHLWARLKYEEKGMMPIDDFKYVYPVAQTFLVRKTINRNGKEEMKLARKEFTHPFENINLKQIKKCERCETFFYAAKNDGRIKFCSTQCGNAQHQETFQKQKRENK
jgi:hypothetical protein